MKNKVIGLLLMLGLVVALSACSSSSGGGKFTSDQEETYLNEYYDLSTKPEDPKVVMADLDKNIKRLSQEGASSAIDVLINNVYEKAPKLTEKMNGLQETMTEQAKNGIDFNKPDSFGKVKDATLKAFLNEVHEQSMTIIQDVGGYMVVPNMEELLHKYQSYMSEPQKEMVQFSKDEYEKPFFDYSASKFNLDIVVDRILKMEEAMKKYSDPRYLPAFSESKSYYYEVYFGSNSDYLVDSKKTILPEVLDHYKKTMEAHQGTQLAKDIASYLEKLKETNNKVTDDVIVFVSELTKNEESTNPQTQQTDAVSDAVTNAIEANGK